MREPAGKRAKRSKPGLGAVDDPPPSGLTEPRLTAGRAEESTVGGGGCVAHALYEIGVGETVDDTKERLNSQIDVVWAELQHQHKGSATVPRQLAGVDNDKWHPLVIKSVLIDADFHFTKLPHERRQNLANELAREDTHFLIDGVLNSEFVDADGEIVETDPADVDGPRPWEKGGASHWRHAVIVVDGKIKEQSDQEWDISVLHLNAHGDPDNRKGYFWSIAKVYEITHRGGGG